MKRPRLGPALPKLTSGWLRSALPKLYATFKHRPERPEGPVTKPDRRKPRPQPPPTTGPGPVIGPDPADIAMSPNYPRPWLYLGMNGFGNPLMVDGVIDQTYAAAAARFSLVTINVTPFSDLHREIVPTLKGYNPGCRVLWYDTFVERFLYATVGTMWKAEWDLTVGPPDARLYCEDGTTFPWRIADGTRGYRDIGKIKEGLLAIWKQYAYGDGVGAGFFLDFALRNTYGTSEGNPPSPLDLARAGYSTAAELNASSAAGLDFVIAGLAPLGAVFGNSSGQQTNQSHANWTGDLFEGWDPGQGSSQDLRPPLNYASFDAAMAALATWRRPGIDGGGTGLVKVENRTAAYSTTWNKCARYCLGSATIQGGYGYYGSNRDPLYVPYEATLWSDESSVTPLSMGGAHDPTATFTGWLGRPTDLPVKDPASGIYVRHFTHGAVIVNGPTSPATIDMGANYRRIQGLHDPTVNNGVTAQFQTVAPNDAVFLLGPV